MGQLLPLFMGFPMELLLPLGMLCPMPPLTLPTLTPPWFTTPSTLDSSTPLLRLMSTMLQVMLLMMPVRIHILADGETLSRLWKEVKAGVLCVPCTSGSYCSGGALQLHPDNPHHAGALRLCIYGGQ